MNKTDRPNVILLLIDDMGYGDVAAHGNDVIKTPNFDKLHGAAVRFENFCVSPTCAPTRAALMTGMHEFKSDVSHTTLGRNILHLDSTTLAQLMKSAGYKTGMFGKWHLGTETKYRPENRGFDVALTSRDDTQNDHFDPVLIRNGAGETHEGYREDILFREAMRFIEENRNDRFFCYIPTYSPHTPLVVPDEWSDMYPDQPEKARKFMGMVSNVDHNVGLLLSKLKELNLRENTVVVALNDNGGTWGVDVFNGGMRGRKSHTLLGGIRAFSFWSWPGKWKPAAIGEMTGHVDILPTLADLAGAELAVVNQLDRLEGRSLLPFLEGSEVDDEYFETRMLAHHRARWSVIPDKTDRENAELHKYAYCSVRMGNHLLMRVEPCDNPECTCCVQIRERSLPGATGQLYTENPDYYEPPKPGKWQLYDIGKDVYQSQEIADEHPDLVNKMSSFYDRWWEKAWER